MSTYEHSLLAARFAALAPRPFPGDWDDVLDRAGSVRPRRRRLARSLWRGGSRRKLVVALAVAVLVTAVAAAAYGTVRVLFLDKGFIGLPPVGATPSAPESGELVVQWEGFSATLPGGPIVRAWVYADGRIIWDRRAHGWDPRAGIPGGANELNSGYLEQRLAPEGLESLRSAVADLFDRSRTLLETVPADGDPWWGDVRLALFVPNDYSSGNWGSVGILDDGRLVRLHWQSIEDKEYLDLGGPLATPAQLSALRRVDALFSDPASVLPASAWAELKARAYVPSHYAVCMEHTPPTNVSHILSLLPARAGELLSDKGWRRRENDLIEARESGHTVVVGRSVTYCSKLTTEKARELADALSGLEPEPGWKHYVLGYRVAEGPPGGDPTRIWFEPYFPHGQAAFSWPFG